MQHNGGKEACFLIMKLLEQLGNFVQNRNCFFFVTIFAAIKLLCKIVHDQIIFWHFAILVKGNYRLIY